MLPSNVDTLTCRCGVRPACHSRLLSERPCLEAWPRSLGAVIGLLHGQGQLWYPDTDQLGLISLVSACTNCCGCLFWSPQLDDDVAAKLDLPAFTE